MPLSRVVQQSLDISTAFVYNHFNKQQKGTAKMLREELLKIFETNKGKTLSGSALALKLNVSRNAVWKAVEVLRREGYDIVSVKKSGYTLMENSDVLSEFKIRSSLIGALNDIELHIFKTLDSTSSYLNRKANENAGEWCVAACEEQTDGACRNLSEYVSPSGKGVYMSVLLRPDKTADILPRIVEIAAESVSEAIKRLTNTDTVIKNGADLYCDGKKLCGILCEAMIECISSKVRYVCIGIGIRIYKAESKDEISLFDITGKYCNRSELIAEILNKLYERYSEIV